MSATDPDEGNLTYSASDLPVNATFNATTRLFAWIPDSAQAGTYNVTFRVTDGTLSDAESVNISVGAVNRAPVFAPIGNKTVITGNLLNFTVNATDPDDSSLTYSAADLPAPATSDPATGLVPQIPDILGDIFHILSSALAAADPGSTTLTYAADDLPSNATFDSETGSFAWTPTAAQLGTYKVTFRVTDGSLSDTESVYISVTEGRKIFIRLK